MYGKNPADDLWEQLQKANRVASRILCPRPARPKRRPGKSRKRLSMRPEKRPQTIMEQYRYREMMRQPHNQDLKPGQRWWMQTGAPSGTFSTSQTATYPGFR
jgi:hypothetical protein